LGIRNQWNLLYEDSNWNNFFKFMSLLLFAHSDAMNQTATHMFKVAGVIAARTAWMLSFRSSVVRGRSKQTEKNV
jgi:hypothetical protein